MADMQNEKMSGSLVDMWEKNGKILIKAAKNKLKSSGKK